MWNAAIPVLFLILFSWFVGKRGANLLSICRRPLRHFSHYPALFIAFPGCISLAISFAFAALGSIPPPRVHDEFSYLLSADTFAHGRLTNPPHPMWIHFESPHIIQQPTYASKYPVAPGLFMAAGQLIAGLPIIGVWVSTALACCAITWMLLAWLKPRWAVLGGVLTAIHPLVLIWSQCYWGGSVTVLGGALVLGAVGRLAKETKFLNGILLGLGMAVLANSRPFEGLVLSLLALGFLAHCLLQRPDGRFLQECRRILYPASLVLIPTAAFLGYYNWRVTGNPIRLPYQVHEAAYGYSPLFLWQSARTLPNYHHEELRKLHEDWEWQFYERQLTFAGLAEETVEKIKTLFNSYFNPTLLIVLLALLAIPFVLADARMRGPILIGALFLLAILTETWMHPHYAAPIMGLFMLIVLSSLRRLACWKWHGRSVGRFLIPGALVLSVILLIPFCKLYADAKSKGWQVQRNRILSELAAEGGEHLIIIRYSPRHSPHDEWVYNRADIDGSPVVWAREMAPAQNQRLIDYFKSRSVWLLEADKEVPHLIPYPMGEHTVQGHVAVP
jgi:hypothetical protein